jgi:aspyridone synthetase trans-acting enoyl reductase
MKALKLAGTGRMELKKTCDLPTFLDDEVLIQVMAIAINPFDSKSADLSPTIGATMGCDFAGVIIAVGSSLRKSVLVGDRVCGCIFGNNPDRLDNGAFAEILAAPADLTLRIPDGMTFQTAATLGIGISTTGLALYHILGLPLPSIQPSRSDYVLVNGGATATGTLAIQLLRLQVSLE